MSNPMQLETKRLSRSSPSKMFSKSHVISATSLDQEVDYAEEKYIKFRDRLKSLISVLKTYHGAMVEMNESEQATMNVLRDFAINSPISEIIIGTNRHPPAKKVELKSDEPQKATSNKEVENEDKDEPPNEDETDSTGSQDESHDLTVLHSNKKEMEPPSHLVEKTKNYCEPVPRRIPPNKMPDTPNPAALPTEYTNEYTNEFDSVLGDCRIFDGVDESFMSVFDAVNDVNQRYAEKFKTYIVDYVEQWEMIISKRIEGRLLEFRKMRQDYAHYTHKVKGLHLRKTKHQKSLRLATKLERNELKLSGAEEAHDDFGKILLGFIEEVTVVYWKDILPLLHMVMRFRWSWNSDVGVILERLGETDAILESVGDARGVSVRGRLGELRVRRAASISKFSCSACEKKPERRVELEHRDDVQQGVTSEDEAAGQDRVEISEESSAQELEVVVEPDSEESSEDGSEKSSEGAQSV